MNVVAIIIGLVVWFVVPILTDGTLKKKAHKKAVSMLCRIVGIAIIVTSIAEYLTVLSN